MSGWVHHYEGGRRRPHPTTGGNAYSWWSISARELRFREGAPIISVACDIFQDWNAAEIPGVVRLTFALRQGPRPIGKMHRCSIRHPLAVSSGYSQSDLRSCRPLTRNQAASFHQVRMRQTFMPKSFSAFRKAIFSLASRGRSTARNQSVPSFMSANG